MSETACGDNDRVAIPGYEIREPDEITAQEMLLAVAKRDIKEVARIFFGLPTTAWGGVPFSKEDREWMDRVLREEARQRTAKIWGDDWEQCD
jgi:hypothetical protein